CFRRGAQKRLVHGHRCRRPCRNARLLRKADTTQLGSAAVAIDKARSAALYKRPTKAFEDALAKGGVGLRVLALQGAVPVDGGVPLLVEGKIVGAIGVSGDLSEHDAQRATVGAAALTAATTGR